MSGDSVYSEVIVRLMEAETRFRKACGQIMVLNRLLQELQKRYEAASKQHMRTVRYSLRLRIAVTEGIRNMYYEYAQLKADEITEMRRYIIEQSEQIGISDDSELDESYNYYEDSDYVFTDSELEYSDFEEVEEEDEVAITSSPMSRINSAAFLHVFKGDDGLQIQRVDRTDLVALGNDEVHKEDTSMLDISGHMIDGEESDVDDL